MRNIVAPNGLVSEMWAGRKLGQRFQLSFLNLYFSVCMFWCLAIKMAGMLQGKVISKCWRLCIFWQVCISWTINFPQAFIFWLWMWSIQKGALLVLCGNRLQSSLALGTWNKLFVCEELICLWPAQLLPTACAHVRRAQVWCWQAAGDDAETAALVSLTGDTTLSVSLSLQRLCEVVQYL